MAVEAGARESRDDFCCGTGVEVGRGAGPRVKVRGSSRTGILSLMSAPSGGWLVDCL